MIKNVIKSILYNKYCPNGVTILAKKIYKPLKKYSGRTEYYKNILNMLNYITPYIGDDIERLKKDFEKKSRHIFVRSSVIQQDRNKIKDLINKINPEIFPPATGELRSMQNYTLDFAKEILSDITTNSGVSIWLDGGTLLGAIRHQGFIPWDDDMDFALLRPDYEKLIQYLTHKYVTVDTSNWLIGTANFENNLREALKQYPNKIFCFRHIDAFKCVRGTTDRFVILDFFAFDYYNDIHNVDTLRQYSKLIKKEKLLAKTYQNLFDIQRRELKLGKDIVAKSNVINMGVDNHGFYCYSIKENLRQTDIFPLKKVKFEDWEFYAPNNHHNYLKSIYNFYNRLPQNGIKFGVHVNTRHLNLNPQSKIEKTV